MKDKVTLSPYVGLILAFLEQNFAYSTETASQSIPITFGLDYDYAVREDLDSWYAGLVLGADVIFTVTPELSFSLGGAVLPLYAHTEMDIKFNGDMTVLGLQGLNTEDTTTRVSDSASNWTFRAMAKAEATYRIKWFAVSLSGMVDYWDDVPVIDYPDYSSGDWSIAPSTPVHSEKVPEIDGKRMINYGVMFNVAFYFM
jgi:hypothetical protein